MWQCTYPSFLIVVHWTQSKMEFYGMYWTDQEAFPLTQLWGVPRLYILCHEAALSLQRFDFDFCIRIPGWLSMLSQLLVIHSLFQCHFLQVICYEGLVLPAFDAIHWITRMDWWRWLLLKDNPCHGMEGVFPMLSSTSCISSPASATGIILCGMYTYFVLLYLFLSYCCSKPS